MHQKPFQPNDWRFSKKSDNLRLFYVFFSSDECVLAPWLFCQTINHVRKKILLKRIYPMLASTIGTFFEFEKNTELRSEKKVSALEFIEMMKGWSSHFFCFARWEKKENIWIFDSFHSRIRALFFRSHRRTCLLFKEFQPQLLTNNFNHS